MKRLDVEKSGKNLVSRHNNLVNATLVTKTNKINLRARKIFLGIVSLISPNDEDFHGYKLTVSELETLTGVNKSNLYRELQKICLSLVGCVVTIKEPNNPKGFLISSLFSTADYKPGEGFVEFRFDPKLKPYLLQLKGDYMSLRYAQVRVLSSDHTISMYEFCRQILSINSVKEGKEISYRTITLCDLRDFLDIGEKYKRFQDLRRKVINPAQKELLEKSDLKFEFNSIRTGKSITSLRFCVMVNGKEVHGREIDDSNDDRLTPIVNEVLLTKIKKLIPDISSEMLEILSCFSETDIEEALTISFDAFVSDKIKGSIDSYFLGVLKKKSTLPDTSKMSMSWEPRKDIVDHLVSVGTDRSFIGDVLIQFKLHYSGKTNKNFDRIFVKWVKEDWEKHKKTYPLNRDSYPSERCLLEINQRFFSDFEYENATRLGDRLWRGFVSSFSSYPNTKKTQEGWDCEFINYVEEIME